MCTATSISRKQQKHRLLKLFQRQGHPKLTNPVVHAVRFPGRKKKRRILWQLFPLSQLIGKGVIFSYARICCTHTQTSHFACCTASTAVHMSKALWTSVSQWGCYWHLELGNSLLYRMSHTLQAVYYPRPLLTNCQYYAQ